MSYNTSSFSYRFITRPAAVLAFSTQRHLGVAYKFKSRHIFFEQGIFSEKPYHRKNDSKGLVASGRFVYKALNTEKTTLHFGVSARYRKILDDSVSFASAAFLETHVDGNNYFLNITNNNVESASEGTFEFLFRTNRFFVRGEYILRYVKDHNPAELYGGGYVESGFIILRNNGENNYEYNEKASAMGGSLGKHSLEAVIRYSYTNLNAGGRAHIGTAGFSYFINKYIGFMAEYNIAFVKKSGISNIINMAQLKVMFSF
jgi:phosphate-selective porin OprO/OprP